jgi:hypothetical protein
MKENLDVQFAYVNDKAWEHFGEDSNEPCFVCGFIGESKVDSRYGVPVCQLHAGIKEKDIPNFIELRKTFNKNK